MKRPQSRAVLSSIDLEPIGRGRWGAGRDSE
jgi:hypothetical protein